MKAAHDYRAAPAPISAAADSAESKARPQLVLKLVQDKVDGPLAAVSQVMAANRKSQEFAIEQGSPDKRRFVFQTLSPDHYQLTVQLKDGQECIRPLLIRDDKPQELTILCPGLRKEVPVSITLAPLPEELQRRNFEVTVNIVPGPVEIGPSKWSAASFPPQLVTFDRATGLPTATEMWLKGSQRHFDLSELPADERSVFLPIGTVNYWFSAAEVSDGPGSHAAYGWPKETRAATVGLKQTISADQKTWKLELPQEYLDEMLGQELITPMRP